MYIGLIYERLNNSVTNKEMLQIGLNFKLEN